MLRVWYFVSVHLPPGGPSLRRSCARYFSHFSLNIHKIPTQNQTEDIRISQKYAKFVKSLSYTISYMYFFQVCCRAYLMVALLSIDKAEVPLTGSIDYRIVWDLNILLG